MAGKPQDRPVIREERASRADGGDPMYDPEMSLYDNSGSLVVTIPSTVQDIHGFDIGDEVTLEIYPDGIWIGAGDETDE